MNQTPKRGLGRGFDSLISNDFDKSLLLTADDRVEKIPIDKLSANPHQPRSHFDETALAELAQSIKHHGVIQPLVVTPVKDGSYVLVAGERRWRASRLAGLKTVPAIVRERQEIEQLELALIENVQRVDLSPLEQAYSIQSLVDQFNLSLAEIAQRLGKAVSTVSNMVRLTNLPETALKALAGGKITEGHARSILALKDDRPRQDYLLKSIIEHGWSVRQAERFVTSVKQGIKEPAAARKRAETKNPATRQLSQKLGTPVTIRRTAKGGKLEISFRDDTELDRLINLF
jgi:ParB family chromosome partitioning protein